MHWVELRVARFLQTIGDKSYKIPEGLLNKFGEETRAALKSQFEREARGFSLYPSNVGKPLCVLQMDKEHGTGQGLVTRNLLGELVEDVVLFLLYASGVKVLAEQEPIKYKIGGIELSGRIDVVVENPKGEIEIYDIKSASEYSFKTKKEQSFKDILTTDTYGYVHQLFVYSEAYEAKGSLKGKQVVPGGFIFCNKSDGSMFVLRCPSHHEEIKEKALKEVAYNIKHLNDPFKRQYEDIEETFNKKKTGNRVLKMPCTMCSHVHRCWPGVQMRQQIKSTSKNPKVMFYTHIEEA